VEQFTGIADAPAYVRYLVYLLIGALRGFTLIPSTYLIVLGLLFIPPLALFILTMAGIMVSATLIYYFSELTHLGSSLERKYPKQIAKIKTMLEKNELPVVILWSMFPFTPTDLICYVCGSLKIDIKKYLLGVFIGEGITCAVYIFFGKEMLLLFLKIF